MQLKNNLFKVLIFIAYRKKMKNFKIKIPLILIITGILSGCFTNTEHEEKIKKAISEGKTIIYSADGVRIATDKEDYINKMQIIKDSAITKKMLDPDFYEAVLTNEEEILISKLSLDKNLFIELKGITKNNFRKNFILNTTLQKGNPNRYETIMECSNLTQLMIDEIDLVLKKSGYSKIQNNLWSNNEFLFYYINDDDYYKLLISKK